MRLAGIVVALTLAATAAAAPTKVAVKVSPSVVAAGAAITVTGTGWPAGSSVVLAIGPPASEADPVATVRADQRGRISKRIRIHAQAEPGQYVLLACRHACAVKASARFRIVAP